MALKPKVLHFLRYVFPFIELHIFTIKLIEYHPVTSKAIRMTQSSRIP